MAIRGVQAQPTAVVSGDSRPLPLVRPAISAASISQRPPVPPGNRAERAAIAAP
jgi:hypothetical protein